MNDTNTTVLRVIRSALDEALKANAKARTEATVFDELLLRYEGFGLGYAVRYAHEKSRPIDVEEAISAHIGRFNAEVSLSRDTREQVFAETYGLRQALAIVMEARSRKLGPT